jgi:hypothetical protein
MPFPSPSSRLTWLAPAAWTIYLLLPAPGWALLDGFPLTPPETLLVAAMWLAYWAWHPAWRPTLPLALVVFKIAIGAVGFADRGLAASYFANDAFTQPASRHTIDRQLDFRAGFGRDLPRSSVTDDGRPFSVAWSGFLYLPRDQAVTIFAGGRDVSSGVVVDGRQVVTLRPGSSFSRALVPLRAGWRHIAVTVASSGKGREFYAGVVDAAGQARPFGDDRLYRRRVPDSRIAIDRATYLFTWALDLLALGYLGVALAVACARSDLINRDGVTLGLIAVGVVLVFVALPHEIGGDGRVRFDALSVLLEHGRVPAIAYSLAGPLFSAPLFYVGAFAYGPEWWCARYNAVLLVVMLAALNALLGVHVERPLRWTFLLAIVAASMFPQHTRGYDAEMFTATCASIGIAALVTGRMPLGWALLVIGAVNTPAALIALLLVAAWQVWTTKRMRHFVPVALAAALIVLESSVRRGGPLVTGYEANAGFRTVMPYSGLPGFSYPLLLGLLAILLSFGKGLLFYAPGLVVPIGRDDGAASRNVRAYHRTSMVFLAGLVLVYAKWWAWYGGWTWGPRFFLFASVPASLAIAVHIRRGPTLRPMWLAGLSVVLGLSVWVAIDGAVFDQRNVDACVQNDYAQEFLCWYVPEFSALWRPFVAPTTPAPRDLVFAGYALTAGAWLSAPLLARMRALAGAGYVAAVGAGIKSLRF